MSGGSGRETCNNMLTHSAVLSCIAGHIAIVSPFQSWVNELYSVSPESLGWSEILARRENHRCANNDNVMVLLRVDGKARHDLNSV
jgi:hypothetical protein